MDREAHEIAIASDSLAYICSVEHDADENAIINLREIDLVNETVGPPEVVDTSPLGNYGHESADQCSLTLSTDGNNLVVAYDWVDVDLSDAIAITTRIKDLTTGTWGEPTEQVGSTAFGTLFPGDRPTAVTIRTFGGGFGLYYKTTTGVAYPWYSQVWSAQGSGHPLFLSRRQVRRTNDLADTGIV